jgi:hypothetical protein
MRGRLKQETLDVVLQSLAQSSDRNLPPQSEIAYESLDDFADAQGLPTDIWDKDDIDWIT